MSTSACTCGNQACAVRAARSLRPFCQIPAPAPSTLEGFRTYKAAAETCKPGERVLSVGQYLQGSARRFIVVPA